MHVLRNIDAQVVGVVYGRQQACRLRESEVLSLDAVVVLSSRFDAIDTTTEGGDVEVTVEDLILGVLGLDADRQLHFLELALNGCLGRSVVGSLTCIRVSNFFRTHHQNVLHILLADGGTTLHISTSCVGDDGTSSTDEVNTAVLVEARVFGCDGCVNDVGGNVFKGNSDAVLGIERGKQNI